MTADLHLSCATEAPSRCARFISRFPWPLLAFAAVIVVLLADRIQYVRTFGSVYTEADQTLLWYQADDIAHGIFREPCYYGQAYNVPVEAWLAAPLLLCGVPHAIALPVATIALALLPFLVLATIAYRKGQRWTASLIMLIPLALPVEYVVVTSIPRGFVGGIAIGSLAVALWLCADSRKTLVLAGFFSVLAVTVNPNSSILLLAGGLYALLGHFRSARFYIWSLVGASLALPAPLLIHLFYKHYPAADVYRSQPPVVFHWRMLRETLFAGGLSLNTRSLDLFFADFVPIAHRGAYMLVAFAVMIAVPLVLGRFKAAISLGVTVLFIVGTLGIVRVHTALPQVFYSGSRMYLALPVVFALFVLWCAAPMADGFKRRRFIGRISGSLLLCVLVACASLRNLSQLKAPSPLIERTWPLDIETVHDLAVDARATAEICRKYNVTLVIPGDHFLSCFEEAGPVMSNRAFETLYPPFERRIFRIEEERKRLHTAVLLYRPSFARRLFAMSVYPRSQTVSQSPNLVLIQLDKPDSGFNIAEALGFGYNAHL